MDRRVRLGILSLRFGAVSAWLSAGAWILVATAASADLQALPGTLILAGALSLVWAGSVVGISVVVGLKRRPLVGVLGILAGSWVAVFAFDLTRFPVAESAKTFGNLWFAMGSVGILVAGLSGISSSVRLRWFARVLAILWLIGAILSLGGEQFDVPLGDLGESGIRRVALQWLGLLGFGIWTLWSARWLARDIVMDWSHPARQDLATYAEIQQAWLPYGPWPRRWARIASATATLAIVPIALDRFGRVMDLRVGGFEVAFGLAAAAFAIVVGRTTPRLGHTRFDLFEWIPHIGLFLGLTEAGVLGGLAIAADGTLDGVFDGRRQDGVAFFALALLGLWMFRVAARQHVGPRRHGIVVGASLLAAGAAGVVVAEAAQPAIVPGLIVSGSLALAAIWMWRLGSVLVPGAARPASVFALPAISIIETPVVTQPPGPMPNVLAAVPNVLARPPLAHHTDGEKDRE